MRIYSSVISICLSPALFLIVATSLSGQERLRLTEEKCIEISQAVDSGDLDAVSRNDIEQCGTLGADIIATVIQQSQNAPLKSIGIMGTVYSFAGSYRDKSVFEAAQSTAKNSQASILVRVTGLYVLGIYYKPDGLLEQNLLELATGPVTCHTLVSGSTHRRGGTLRPLPASAVVETAATMDKLVRDASTPPQVRQVAKCIRFAMYRHVPSHLPLGALGLSYKCDGRYTVVNKFDEPIFGVKVTVTTPDTIITLTLEMEPKSTKELSMPRKATVRIISNDKVIAEARDGEKECAEKTHQVPVGLPRLAGTPFAFIWE